VNILFYDLLQNSNAPKKLTSASLADYYTTPAELEMELPEAGAVDCVGIGYMNSDILLIDLIDEGENTFTETINFQTNGLYLLSKKYQNIVQINFHFSSTRVGRIGIGRAVNIKTSIPKEPNLVSTNSPRVTLSGQVIEGLGGYNYWHVTLDSRYKIDEEKLREIIKSFPYLSKGLPLFVSFEEEKNRLPFSRLYCNDTKQQNISFESSINKYLFSRKFVFEERF
jgi:hypothetical protein